MANLSKLTLPVKDTITGKVTQQTFDMGGGSGGHTIKNQSGTAMTQRTNLKFNNATVVDDATNDVTIVTPTGDSTNFVGTIEEWEALSQAEQDMYDSVDLTDDYTDVTDELEALTYYEQTTLAAGILISKIGKVCILQIQTYLSLQLGDNIIATINDQKYIPREYTRACVLVLSAQINNAFMAINTNGKINVYNADGAVNNVQVIGEIVYFTK